MPQWSQRARNKVRTRMRAPALNFDYLKLHGFAPLVAALSQA